MCPENPSRVVRCRSRWPNRPDREVPVAEDETLFVALRRAGIPVASSCSGGVVCGRCVVRVIEGEGSVLGPEEEETEILRRDGAGPGDRLACRTIACGDGVVLTTGYW